MCLMRLCPCIFAFPVTSLTLALHSKFVCDVVEGDIDSNTSPTFSTAEEDLATESPRTCSTSKAKENIKKSFNEAAKKATERALNKLAPATGWKPFGTPAKRKLHGKDW